MTDYDHTRAYVATEHARTGSGLMEMILARLDADKATIDALTAKLAKAEALAEQYCQTIDWNRQQHEREVAEIHRRGAEWDRRTREACEDGLRIARLVHGALLAGRKTVRIADLINKGASA